MLGHFSGTAALSDVMQGKETLARARMGGTQGHPFQGVCLPKQIGPDLNRGGLA